MIYSLLVVLLYEKTLCYMYGLQDGRRDKVTIHCTEACGICQFSSFHVSFRHSWLLSFHHRPEPRPSPPTFALHDAVTGERKSKARLGRRSKNPFLPLIKRYVLHWAISRNAQRY
jgi:hypothetical protein